MDSKGEKIMFIKKHRYTCILVLIYILVVILGIKVKEILIPDEGKATYGERLKDISKHPISEEIYSKVDSEMKEDDKVEDISHRLSGKIVNYYLTVRNDVSKGDAKALGSKIITYFDEDALSYYSFQVYLIKKDETQNDFPIIGMKDPLSDSIVWTKDRDITVSEQNEE